MDQYRTARKALNHMIEEGLIVPGREERVREYLNEVWGAGMDHKVKENGCEREVIQEDRNHIEITRHPSAMTAARQHGMSKSGILNAIKNGLLTRCGFYFRYAEAEEDSNLIITKTA